MRNHQQARLSWLHPVLDRNQGRLARSSDRAFSAALPIAWHPEPSLAWSFQAGSTKSDATAPLSRPFGAEPEYQMRVLAQFRLSTKLPTIFAYRFGLVPLVRELPASLGDFLVGSSAQALRPSLAVVPLGFHANALTVPQAAV